MEIIRAKDYSGMSRKAANILAAQIVMKPNCVLGLATGSTPVGAYRELVRRYKEGELDFSRVRTVNLDEYKGLGPSHSQSYRYFMDSHLFDHVNINKAGTFVPDGLAEDDGAECRRYDQVVARMGGVDLQLLGLGHNGHIGFNEPGEEYPKNTHCVKLAESTIQANSRLFERIGDVPEYAYTMGVGTIFKAAKVLVAVSGGDKARIVREAFFGPVTPKVPASVLQLHRDVTVVGDEAALALIERRG
ncbi:MAG: glucosamine-6-phosphate deaminase [Lachnospiraceae bacterium]|nr:glucosamine-6-phosphate deaminase [Lachnospiraceae bacterium]